MCARRPWNIFLVVEVSVVISLVGDCISISVSRRWKSWSAMLLAPTGRDARNSGCHSQAVRTRGEVSAYW